MSKPDLKANPVIEDDLKLSDITVNQKAEIITVLQAMRIKMTMSGTNPSGEITRFDVLARCPHCENETRVTQDELRGESVQCQHCDEEFEIYLGD